MKVRVIERFRTKYGVKYPGEVIKLSSRQADVLIRKGVVKPHKGEKIDNG